MGEDKIKEIADDVKHQMSGIDSCTWAMLCHLSSFLGFVISGGFVNFIGPLVIWLVNKDDQFVDYHGRESLNFQISIFIYMMAAGFLCFFLIGIPIVIGLAIFQIIEVIKASIAAKDGQYYEYPMTIRFL